MAFWCFLQSLPVWALTAKNSSTVFSLFFPSGESSILLPNLQSLRSLASWTHSKEQTATSQKHADLTLFLVDESKLLKPCKWLQMSEQIGVILLVRLFWESLDLLHTTEKIYVLSHASETYSNSFKCNDWLDYLQVWSYLAWSSKSEADIHLKLAKNNGSAASHWLY